MPKVALVADVAEVGISEGNNTKYLATVADVCARAMSRRCAWLNRRRGALKGSVRDM